MYISWLTKLMAIQNQYRLCLHLCRGLDSSSTSSCVRLLRDLAREGRTVVCTIHQPSALVFEQFDHLYAVAGGHCIYQGSIPQLVPHMASIGLVCPRSHNPADFCESTVNTASHVWFLFFSYSVHKFIFMAFFAQLKYFLWFWWIEFIIFCCLLFFSFLLNF